MTFDEWLDQPSDLSQAMKDKNPRFATRRACFGGDATEGLRSGWEACLENALPALLEEAKRQAEKSAREACAAIAEKEMRSCGTHLYPSDIVHVAEAIRHGRAFAAEDEVPAQKKGLSL